MFKECEAISEILGLPFTLLENFYHEIEEGLRPNVIGLVADQYNILSEIIKNLITDSDTHQLDEQERLSRMESIRIVGLVKILQHMQPILMHNTSECIVWLLTHLPNPVFVNQEEIKERADKEGDSLFWWLTLQIKKRIAIQEQVQLATTKADEVTIVVYDDSWRSLQFKFKSNLSFYKVIDYVKRRLLIRGEFYLETRTAEEDDHEEIGKKGIRESKHEEAVEDKKNDKKKLDITAYIYPENEASFKKKSSQAVLNS